MPKLTQDCIFNWFTGPGDRELIPTAASVADKLELFFDWLPAVVSGHVTFRTAIVRGATRSSVEFTVDLARLDSDELERLHGVLSRRHAGLDSGPEIAASVAWLLGLSLQQTSCLDLHARRFAVRQILLVS
jgi:hypothetical protein